MQSVNLKRLARTNQSRVVIGGVEGRRTTERMYSAALRGLLSRIAVEMRTEVIPQYQAEMTRRRDSSLINDGVADWFSGLRVRRDEFTGLIAGRASRLLDAEAQRHSARWIALVKARVNVDLSAVVDAEDLRDHLTDVNARNLSLIQGLYDATVRNLERIVLNGVLAAQGVGALRSSIQETLRVSRSRANLIAVNETSNLVSELNQIRQEQAGITSYQWSTAGDERVRELHDRIDGETYQWGEATGAEGGLPPGRPVRCRCNALAVLE